MTKQSHMPNGAVELFTDNDWYTGHIEAVDEVGAVFLHVEVKQWTKETLEILRQDLDNLLTKGWELGLDYICAYGDDPKAAKFIQLIKPTDERRSFGPQGMYTLSVWETYMKE